MKTKRFPSATTAESLNGPPVTPRKAAAVSEHGPMIHDLHRRAEAQMRRQRKNQKSQVKLPQAETDPQRLLHELQVHQVELELQNEELRKTRDEMEAARDKYSDLYDFAPVGYFTLAADGKIQQLNLTGAHLVGMERSRLVGQPFGRLVPVEVRPAFHAFLKQVFAGQSKQADDFELSVKGQPPRTVHLEAQRLLSGQECRVAMVDITERQRAAEAATKLAAIVQTTDDAIYSKSPAGVITSWNPGAERMYGYSAKEIVGKHVSMLIPSARAGESERLMAKSRRGEPVTNFETERVRKDGSLFCVSLSSAPLRDATGQWVGVSMIARDITAHKRAEDEVRVSEVRYRRLFETAHDGVLLLDPATRKITDANPFMTSLLGYSHDQFVGKELFEIGLLKDESASREMFQKLRRDREVRYEDLPLESRRGRHQEVEVVANLYQENGHAVIQCNIRDITARKLAEQELSEKARLLDLSHDAIIVRDMEGYIRYWNHGAEELYGWSRQEALGKISHRLFHTKYLTPLKQLTEELHRTNRWTGELVHQTRDGRPITVLVRKTLDRDRHGHPASVLETITDMTERKEAENSLRTSEERFRTLFASAPMAVFVCDHNAVIQQYNHFAGELWGREPICGVERHCGSIKLWLPDGRRLPHNKSPMVEVLRTGIPALNVEVSIERPDGARVPVLANFAALKNVQGQIIGAVTTFIDITERKRAEEARRSVEVLAASNRKLEQEIVRRHAVEESLRKSEQHQRRLLGQLRQLSRQILTTQEEERREISRELHDVIAQTLTGINVRLSALKKEAARSTKGLDRNIARTQRLVEKSVEIVHEFARELRPTVLDDLGLIPALHAFMKSFTTRTGVRTHLTAFAAVEKLESSRRTVLYRVAQEALTNVARHAKASRVDVNIQKLPDGFRMRIKDDGQSFPVERVLQMGGKGRLGLLGMRERVEMIGGKFTVESAPGQGTTIIAQFPLVARRIRGGDKKTDDGILQLKTLI